jgi:hypothetical protein
MQRTNFVGVTVTHCDERNHELRLMMPIRFILCILFSQLIASCTLSSSAADIGENCYEIIAISDEAQWYSPDDFPTDWIYKSKKEFNGRGHFVLEVNRQGMTENCFVVVSTGFEIIDKNICANLARRALHNSVSGQCSENLRRVDYVVKLNWSLRSNRSPKTSIQKIIFPRKKLWR